MAEMGCSLAVAEAALNTIHLARPTITLETVEMVGNTEVVDPRVVNVAITRRVLPGAEANSAGMELQVLDRHNQGWNILFQDFYCRRMPQSLHTTAMVEHHSVIILAPVAADLGERAENAAVVLPQALAAGVAVGSVATEEPPITIRLIFLRVEAEVADFAAMAARETPEAEVAVAFSLVVAPEEPVQFLVNVAMDMARVAVAAPSAAAVILRAALDIKAFAL